MIVRGKGCQMNLVISGNCGNPLAGGAFEDGPHHPGHPQSCLGNLAHLPVSMRKLWDTSLTLEQALWIGGVPIYCYHTMYTGKWGGHRGGDDPLPSF